MGCQWDLFPRYLDDSDRVVPRNDAVSEGSRYHSAKASWSLWSLWSSCWQIKLREWLAWRVRGLNISVERLLFEVRASQSRTLFRD